jgi:hypothetical protein
LWRRPRSKLGCGAKERRRRMKMSSSVTYSEVRSGKFLSDAYPIQKGLKLSNILSPLLFKKMEVLELSGTH